MASEFGRSKIPFSYWLAKVNVMEKSAKRRWPHSQTSEEAPCAKLLNQYSRTFFLFGRYGLEFVKHNTNRPPKQVGDYRESL
jgi:hypothetical protein